MDFCRDRREMVLNYVKEKYGVDNVAQIGTFGTLKAKAAIRDVARALGVDLKRADEVAKMIPETLNIKITEAIEENPELKQQYQADPQTKELVDFAIAMEGLAKSAGTHAAGVVIADQPLIEYVPLQKLSGKEDILTQWTEVEKAGLLKMDFLGLRNLSILDKAVQNVKKHRGVDIVPKDLPLDDKPTFALLQRRETKGIFQLESGGMRDLLTKMKPDKFADIIATSAATSARPPGRGMVMTYVNVKHGREPVPTVHPIVDGVLDETYGVMVYQEQVMRILNRLGGSSSPSRTSASRRSRRRSTTSSPSTRSSSWRGREEQHAPPAGGRHLLADREVRRLRLQQVALHRLRSDRLPDRLSQGATPGVHGGALLSCGMEVERADRGTHRRLPPDADRDRCRRTSTSAASSSRSSSRKSQSR